MMTFAALALCFLAAAGTAFAVALSRWIEQATAREIRHRLALLGLLTLTVLGVGASAPTPDGLIASTAARVVLAGLLALLWAYWVRAERRRSS